jgi:RNA polymerase sigma-70 factor (ECF subfamily)
MRCLMNAWHENETQLKNWLIKQTGNYDQAQDLLQDVFIKAMKHKDVFCRIENAKSWLFKTAKNSFIDSYRKSKGEVQSLLVDIDDQDNKDMSDSAPILDLQQCLTRVLLELDDEDKEIIEHCDILGMQQSDYAQKKKLSLTATKSRIQRARKKLRQQMIASCNVQFEQDKVCCFTPRK